MTAHITPRRSTLIKTAIRHLRRLHTDTHGQIPVGQMLVVGAIVIPLVIVLVIFRVEVGTFLFDTLIDVNDARQSSSAGF